MNGGRPPDRRARDDRRAQPTAALGPFWLRGRRRWARRQTDSLRGYYVDQPGPGVLAAVITLLLLGILDAVFTLRLIEQGATEVNPLMDVLLSLGPVVFLGVKLGSALMALVFLLIHKTFSVFHPGVRVTRVLWALLMTYAALVGYELVLLTV